MSQDDVTQQLCNSLLDFTRVMYKIRTGREFATSCPFGRESHFLTIIRALEGVFDGKIKRLKISLPARYGKTELAIHFVCWCIAQYPDSNFIYTSFSHSVAKKQTQTIRDIISCREFRELFGVHMSTNTFAKDEFNFKGDGVDSPGSVFGVGTGGSITSRGAGVTNINDRFSGCIIIDDYIKPQDALSDVTRESANDWYYNTLYSRRNSKETPIILIGHRTHEDDLFAKLESEEEWTTIALPALDVHNNALYPEKESVQELLRIKERAPWDFATYWQQEPTAAGNSLFKKEWFRLVENPPSKESIMSCFITVDTAESDKEHADSTVFSFWALHKLEIKSGQMSDQFGLFWVDCWEERMEPKDILPSFMDFYSECSNFAPVDFAAIEKKSTGVTLISALKEVPGMRIKDIDRTRIQGNKGERFREIQYYISGRLISLPTYGRHTYRCIDHMSKITINMAHRHDDIADTCADAIKIALIDKAAIHANLIKTDYNKVSNTIFSLQNQRNLLKNKSYRR